MVPRYVKEFYGLRLKVLALLILENGLNQTQDMKKPYSSKSELNITEVVNLFTPIEIYSTSCIKFTDLIQGH